MMMSEAVELIAGCQMSETSAVTGYNEELATELASFALSVETTGLGLEFKGADWRVVLTKE